MEWKVGDIIAYREGDPHYAAIVQIMEILDTGPELHFPEAKYRLKVLAHINNTKFWAIGEEVYRPSEYFTRKLSTFKQQLKELLD